MKGVVVENRNGSSAVLREDGRIIRKKGIYPVGSEISILENNTIFSLRRIALACLCAVFVTVSFLIYRDYTWTAMAYSTITVRNGASIEYTLNRKGNIIAVKACDEASEEIAEVLSETVMNQPGTEAVENYIRMTDPQEKVDVHVSSREENKEEELIRQLDDVIDREEFPNVHTGRETAPPDLPPEMQPENARQPAGEMPPFEEHGQ